MITEIVFKSKNYVESIMKDNKKNWYYYHCWEHILEVYDRAKYLIEKEWINDDLSEIIFIAIFFHDVAYQYDFKNHEELSSKMCEDFLLKNNYPKDRIDIIKSIIIVTKPIIKPQNILEKIMKDSDLDNLWRKDFFEKWDLVKKELQNITWKKISDQDRNLTIYNLLCNTVFYTDTQRKERSQQLQKNILAIKKLLN